jgi:hypothetical protein
LRIDLRYETCGHGRGGGGVTANRLQHYQLCNCAAAAQCARHTICMFGIAGYDRLGKSGRGDPLDCVRQHRLPCGQAAKLFRVA